MRRDICQYPQKSTICLPGNLVEYRKYYMPYYKYYILFLTSESIAICLQSQTRTLKCSKLVVCAVWAPSVSDSIYSNWVKKGIVFLLVSFCGWSGQEQFDS